MRGDVRLLLAGLTLAGSLCGCAHGVPGNRALVQNEAPAGKAAVISTAAVAAESYGVPAGKPADRSSRSESGTVRLTSGNANLDAGGDPEIETAEPIDAPNSSKEPVAQKTPPEQDQPLTSFNLDDLQAWALEHNPTLSQAEAAVDQQRGNYRQAGLYPNPQFGYLNDTTTHTGMKQSNGLFASQEFVTAKKLKLAKEAAAQEIKRLNWDQAAQRMRVLNDLKIRYYEVLGAQQAVEVAERLEEIARASLTTAERAVKAQQGSAADVLQAKVQLETVRLALEESKNRHEAAWEQLATIVGVSPLQKARIAGSLEGEIPEFDLETCWQELASNSPQLRSSQSQLDHGFAELRSAQAQAIPNITLQTVADRDNATHSSGISTLVALPVPIFNRNQGNIDRAAADIRVDQAELRRVQLVLRDQLVDSFRRYKTGAQQATRLQNSILPNSEENLRLTEQLYDTGQVSFAQVLTAQRSYFEARVAYVEALTDLRKVIVEIDGLQLTGGLNPAAIGSAIQNQPGSGTQRQRALLKGVQDRATQQLLPAAQLVQ